MHKNKLVNIHPKEIKPFKQYTRNTQDIVYDIDFEVFESSPFFCCYAYNIDSIPRALEVLKDPKVYDLVLKEISLDWQDASSLSNSTTIEESLKHSLRIAMLVTLIEQGEKITPVEIDTFSKSCSCLEGHHRLLALKYLGYSSFPAYLGGSIDELETFLNVNMEPYKYKFQCILVKKQ